MIVYLGLGSNLDGPRQQIKQAVKQIVQLDDVTLIKNSSLYASSPMGPQDQPDYINAVIAIETSLKPHDLLSKLQMIEQDHGRVRKRHWGERTLDLDILLYGDMSLFDEQLIVPHPGIVNRNFVLYPLLEIEPELIVPDKGSLKTLIKQCPIDDLVQLEENSYE